MSLLKTIEKISDELPKIVWSANKYGDNIKRIEQNRRERKEEEKKRKAYLKNLDDEDEENGQSLVTE